VRADVSGGYHDVCEMILAVLYKGFTVNREKEFTLGA
jgi:hypothetical protein